MSVVIKQTKGQVLNFLSKLRSIIDSENFKIDEDFILIKNNKEPLEYSTPYTLLDLEYDVYDVVDILRNLEVSDFSEAKIDKNDPEPPILMVFGKYINEKNVYIKIKCRETEDMGQVICVSFHYAQWDMCYPFKY